jgi:hypothetical protein
MKVQEMTMLQQAVQAVVVQVLQDLALLVLQIKVLQAATVKSLPLNHIQAAQVAVQVQRELLEAVMIVVTVVMV